MFKSLFFPFRMKGNSDFFCKSSLCVQCVFNRCERGKIFKTFGSNPKIQNKAVSDFAPMFGRLLYLYSTVVLTLIRPQIQNTVFLNEWLRSFQCRLIILCRRVAYLMVDRKIFAAQSRADLKTLSTGNVKLLNARKKANFFTQGLNNGFKLYLQDGVGGLLTKTCSSTVLKEMEEGNLFNGGSPFTEEESLICSLR